MPNPWDELLQFITDGEDVKASVANRTPEALARRTQYLKDILEAMSASEALFLRNVGIEADAVPGDVVYYDDDEQLYKRALAAVEFSSSAGWYEMAKTSFAVGMVYEKADTQLGTLVTLGVLRNFDLSSAIVSGGGSPTTPGPYFLSAAEPGKITVNEPPISVYILYNSGDGRTHINPVPKNVLESHIHYKYDLFAMPAGDPTCLTYEDWLEFGEVHQILNADENLPGWLPADHPIFQGLAPAGAKFGYNLAQHPEVERTWPPMPEASVHIEQNGKSIELTDSLCPLAIADCNGLWWMQDCYGNAPWAPNYPGCIPLPSSLSSSLSSSSGDECVCEPPLEYIPGHGGDDSEKTITLWFSKMVFKTDSAMVTSLDSCSETSPIIVQGCDGDPATTGRLCLALDLARLTLVQPVSGYNVVKGFGEDTYNRGPVVTGVRPGTGAAIAGIGTPGVDYEYDASEDIWRGDLLVGLANTLNDPREGTMSLVAMDNVVEEYDNISKFFYLLFPGGRTSSVRGRLVLPRIGLSASPLQLKLWFWFVGRSAGALPALTATYRRYPQPTGVDTLPTTDSNIDTGDWTPGLTLAGGDYAEAETPYFDVAVGDTIDFTLGSDGSGPTDGFGIMRFGWHLEVK